MPKTLIKTFSFVIIVLVTSCRQSKPANYSTKTLDCLDELILAEKQDVSSMLEVASEYKSTFRFAEELEDRLNDKKNIEHAEKLVATGEINNAFQVINDRIVERGFSKPLSTSLEKIQAARFIQDYQENVAANSWTISERAREFSRIEANCNPHFRTSKPYIDWVNLQKKQITEKVSKDKALIQDGFEFLEDTISVSRPDLLEISLLQDALFQRSSFMAGVSTSTKDELYKKLTSTGSMTIIKNEFIQKKLSLTKNPVSFKGNFDNIRYRAKNGKGLLALKNLQRLSTEIDIDSKLRQEVVKDIIKSNGWNDASLINSNLFDISYILETFYMANN